MLQGDFYTASNIEIEGTTLKAVLSLSLPIKYLKAIFRDTL